MGNFINKLSKYQIIPRELIFDNTMSDRARFIYCYMASKPDGWEFYLNPMAKEVGYSVETLRKYINELIKNGWLIKGEQKNEGTFGAVTYTLNSTKKPDTEKTRHGKKPTQYIIDSLDITDESFKKDIDKSISQKGSEQGCGDKLPPSDASLPFPPASDAPSPDAVGSSENTACGVNVNSFKPPLPPTPRVSSDVDVDDYDSSNANKSKRKKHKAKFDVYADLSYVDEAYVDIWREWLEYKDAINKQYNVQKGAISQYKSLLKYADNNVILANAIVKKSIEHSWNGLFGLSDKEKEFYLSERSPYYVKSIEPALPNGMSRETYEVYIRNGYEIDEYGRIYKDGIMLK